MNHLTTPVQIVNSKIRILFVDEENIQLEQLGLFFSNHSNVDARYVQDTTEAMAIVLNQDIDVLVFDLNLGQPRNGIDFLESARQLHSKLRLILFTGYTMNDANRVRLDRIGARVVRKQEGKNTLYDNILEMTGNGLNAASVHIEKENQGLREIILQLAANLLADLEQLKCANPKMVIQFNSGTFTPEELISEIKSLSDVGKKFVQDYFHGMSIVKRNRT
jgi:DNA-binding NarL/FixJ family response regulator